MMMMMVMVMVVVMLSTLANENEKSGCFCLADRFGCWSSSLVQMFIRWWRRKLLLLLRCRRFCFAEMINGRTADGQVRCDGRSGAS